MAISQIRTPRASFNQLNPSKIYAVSPYRPTAILNSLSRNPYMDQMNQIIINATSPFKVSDTQTLEAIRRSTGYDSGSSFQTIGNIGAAVGGVTAAAIYYPMLASGIKNVVSGGKLVGEGITGLAVSRVVGSAAILGGLGQTLVGGIQIGIYGSKVLTGAKLGQTASQMLFTPEGRYFAGRYGMALANAFRLRPITTFSQMVLLIANEKLNRTGYGQLPTIIRTPIYMVVSRTVNYFGEFADNQLLGELDTSQQLSYTQLSALRGDLLDMSAGNPFLRGAILAIKDPEKAGQKIGQAYGLWEDDYEAFRFADLRTEYGIDLKYAFGKDFGTFTNGLVDMVGEMIVDTNMVEKTVRNTTTKILSKHLEGESYKNIIYDKSYINLQKLLFKKTTNQEFKKFTQDTEDEYNQKVETLNEKLKSDKEVNVTYTLDEKENVLKSLTKKDLVELGKKNGIDVNQRMSKADLISNLTNLKDNVVYHSSLDKQYEKDLSSLEKSKQTTLDSYSDSRGEIEFSEIGKYLSGGRFSRLIKTYYSQYVDESQAISAKDKLNIKKQNNKLILNLAGQLRHELVSMFGENIDGKTFQDEIDYLLKNLNKKIFESKQPFIEVKDTFAQISNDQSKRKANSYFSDYDFDNSVISTANETGTVFGGSYIKNLLNLNSSFRFHNAQDNKFVKYSMLLLDPLRGGMQLLAQSKMRKLDRDYKKFDYNEALVTSNRIKELKVESKEVREAIEETQKIIENLNEKGNINIKRELEALKKDQEYIDLLNKIEQLETQIKEAELEKNKDALKKLRDDLSKQQEEVQKKRQAIFNKEMNSNSYFRDAQKILVDLEKRLVRLNEIRKNLSKIIVPISYGKETFSRDRKYIDDEKTYKEVLDLFKKLEDEVKKGTIKIGDESYEEYEDFKRALFQYSKETKHATEYNLFLQKQEYVITKTATMDHVFANLSYAIRLLTSRLYEYEAKEIDGMTVGDYLTIRQKEINGEKLTYKEKELLKYNKDVIELLNKSSLDTKELTEKQILDRNKKVNKELYGRKISEVKRDFVNELDLTVLGLPKDVADSIINKIENNEKVDINIYYATELFDFFKDRYDFSEDFSRILLNDKELFNALEKELNSPLVQNALNNLKRSKAFSYKGRSRTFNENALSGDKEKIAWKDLKAIITSSLTQISEMVGEDKKTPLMNDKVLNLLINSEMIDYLTMGLIATHQTISNSKQRTGLDTGSYSVSLSTLSDSQIQEWLLGEIIDKNPAFQIEIDNVDNSLKEMNSMLKTLQDNLKNEYGSDNAKSIFEYLKSEVYHIYGSKFLNAINAKYTKFAAISEFREDKVSLYEKKPFTYSKEGLEEANKKINKMKFDSEHIKDDYRNKIFEMLKKTFFGNMSSEELKKLGIDESLLDNLLFEGVFVEPKEPEKPSFFDDKKDEDLTDEEKKEKEKYLKDKAKYDKRIESTKEQHGLSHEEKINIIYENFAEKLYTEFLIANKKDDSKETKETFIKEIKNKLNEIKEYTLFNIARKAAKAIPTSRLDNFYESHVYKGLKKTGIFNLIDPAALPRIIRGEKNIVKSTIVFSNQDKQGKGSNNYRALTEYFKDNKPSKENLNKLFDTKFGSFYNSDRTEVPLVSLTQLKSSGVLTKEWEDLIYENEIELYVPELDKTIKISKLDAYNEGYLSYENIAAMEGLPLDLSEDAKKEMIASRIKIPSSIRDELKKQTVKEIKYKEISEEKIKSNTIEDYKEYGNSNILKYFLVHLNEADTGGIIRGVQVSPVMELKDKMRYRVVRIGIDLHDSRTNQNKTTYKEIFIPEADVVDESNPLAKHLTDTYTKEGRTYARIKQFQEREGDFMIDIVNDVMNDLTYNLSVKKSFEEQKSFELRESQKNIINLFHNRRYSKVEESDDLVSDFVLLGENNSDLELLLYSFSNRLPKVMMDFITVNNNELFVKQIKEQKIEVNGKEYDKYSLHSVSTSSNLVFEQLIIKNEYGEDIVVPLLDIAQPFGRSIDQMQRASIVLNTLKNSKRSMKDNNGTGFYENEEALVQTVHSKNNEDIGKAFNQGRNLRTLVKDVALFESLTGSTNYEDALVISKSTAQRLFGGRSERETVDNIKMVNRHSGKQSIKVVDDVSYLKAIEESLGENYKGEIPEVIVSEKSAYKRGIYGMMAELKSTESFQRGKDGKIKEKIYVDNEKSIGEHFGITEDMSDDEIINALRPKDNTGYIYYYVTDDMIDEPKAAGDNGVDGATWGVQEIFAIGNLDDISYVDAYGNMRQLDPKGVLAKYMHYKTLDSFDKGTQRYSGMSHMSDLTGKEGRIKNDGLKRSIKNSGYNKILPDATLLGNQVKIPKWQAEKMGMLDKDGNFKTENAKYGLMFRYPTMGRRSFVFVEYLIDDTGHEPNSEDYISKSLNISLSVHELLNADHDGDGMGHFSFVDAKDNIIEIARTAFEHTYQYNTHFSDMRTLGNIEDKVRTTRIPTETEDIQMKKDFFEKQTYVSEETKNDFYLKGSKRVRQDDEFNQSFLRQRTLKDYSGYLTGLFDNMMQIYDMGKVGDGTTSTPAREWFNDLYIKKDTALPDEDVRLKKQLISLGVNDFSSLIALFKDFYSQKTFDYEKHGKQYEAISFKMFYDVNKDRLHFKEHLRRMVASLTLDINATKELEEYLKDLPEEEATELYELRLKNGYYGFTKTVNKNKIKIDGIYDRYLQEKIKVESDERKREILDRGKKKDQFGDVDLDEVDTLFKKAEPSEVRTNKEVLMDSLNESFRKLGLDEITEDSLTDKLLEDIEYDIYNEKIRFSGFVVNGYAVQQQVNGFGSSEKTNIFNTVNELYKKNRNEKGINKATKSGLNVINDTFERNVLNIFKSHNLTARAANNLIVRLYGKDGSYEDRPLMSVLKVIHKDINQASSIGPKEFNTYLSPANVNKFQFAADVLELDLLNQDLLTFEIMSTDNAIDEQKIRLINKQLHSDLNKNIFEYVSNFGVTRKGGIHPAFHNKVIYQLGVFNDLFLGLSSILNNQEVKVENNALVELLNYYINDPGKKQEEKDLALEEVRELYDSLKNFLMFQTVADYIDKENPMNNILIRLFETDGMFNAIPEELNKKANIDDQLIEMFGDYRVTQELDKSSEEYKIIVKEYKWLFEQFAKMTGNDDAEKAKVNLLVILNRLNKALSKETKNEFNFTNDFYRMTINKKLQYLVNIQNIINGTFFNAEDENKNKTYNIFNFELEDINQINKEALLSRTNKRIIGKFFDNAKRTTRNPSIDERHNLLEKLDFEYMQFQMVSYFMDVVSDKVGVVYSTQEFVNEHIRNNLVPDNAVDTIFYLINHLSEKRLKQTNNRIKDLLFNLWDAEMSQTILSELRVAERSDYAVYQNYLSLFMFLNDKPEFESDIDNYINRMEKSLEEEWAGTQYTNSRQSIEYILQLNKMQKQIGIMLGKPNMTPIVFGELESFKNRMYANVLLNGTEIKKEDLKNLPKDRRAKLIDIYRSSYKLKVQELRDSNDPDDIVKLNELEKTKAELNTFLVGNPNISMFGIASKESFIESFFGKIIYDYENGNHKGVFDAEDDSVKSPLEFKLGIENYLIQYRDLKRKSAYKTASQMTGNVMRNIEKETYNEDKLIKELEELSYSNNEIGKIVNAINNVKKKRQRLLKSDNKIDTLSFAKNVNNASSKAGPQTVFLKKTLFNMYAQLTNNPDLDSDVLAEQIRETYNLDVKNNKLHKAQVDVLINHEVMIMISKLVEDNPSLLNNLGEQANFFKDFSDPKNRTKYIIIDNETRLTPSLREKIYELSYVTYEEVLDENGEITTVPKATQEYLAVEIDNDVISFLKTKGFTDGDISHIKEQVSKRTKNDTEKILEDFLQNIAEGKTIIGHNVEGDIKEINDQYNSLIEREITNAFKETLVDHDEIVKDIKELEFKKMVDKIKKDFMKDPFNLQLLGLKNEDERNVFARLADTDINSRITSLLSESYKNELYSHFFYGSRTVYTDDQKHNYSMFIDEVLDIFTNGSNDKEGLKLRLLKAFETFTQISNLNLNSNAMDEIVEAYQDELKELKKKDHLITRIPDMFLDVDGNLKLGEKEFGPNEQADIRKIKFDPTDANIVRMYQMAAIKNVMPLMKEAIETAGLNVKRHEQLSFYNKQVNENFLDTDRTLNEVLRTSTNERVRMHYDRYLIAKASGDKYREYFEIKQAINLNKSDFDKEIINDPYLTNTDINILTPAEPKKILNVRSSNVNKVFNQTLVDGVNEIYGRENKGNKDTVTKLYEISWELSLNDMSEETFVSVLGLTNQGDLAKELYDAYIENYNSLKSSGKISFTLPDGDEYSNIEYNEGLEELFKRMAFTQLINGQVQDKKYLGKYLRMVLDENYSYEDITYKSYEEDPDSIKDQEIKDVKEKLKSKRNLFKNTVIQDERNRVLFENERNKFKNLVLEAVVIGDWYKVQAYLQKRPRIDISKDYLKDFKDKFDANFKEIKKIGINMTKFSYNVDDDLQLKFTKEVNDANGEPLIINYDENSMSIKTMFIKEAINSMFEEINSELYVEEIYETANPDNTTKGITTYQEYMSNITSYLGDYEKSDYEKRTRSKERVNQVKKTLSEKQYRIDKLSSYQISFYDVIDSFRDRETGVINREALFEALTKGYLSRVYRVTMIANMTDSQKLKPEEQKKALEKKINLQDKIKELLDSTRETVYDTSDESILNEFGAEGQAILNKAMDSNLPVIKEISIEKIEDLNVFIEMANNKEWFDGIGLTTVSDLAIANRISYSRYELPKALSKINNTIVKMQKFFATTNPKFFANIIYRNILKNYSAILGSDTPARDSFRFAREGIRTQMVSYQYNKALTYDTEFNANINQVFSELVEMEKSGVYNYAKLNDINKNIKEYLANSRVHLDLFTKNIIDSQGPGSDKSITPLYENAMIQIKFLESMENRLDNLINSTDTTELNFYELRDIMKTLFLNNKNSGYLIQTVSGFGKELNLSSNDKDNKRQVMDTLNLLNLIHKSERAGLMRTPLDLNDTQTTVEMYDLINGVTRDDVELNLAEAGVDWIVNHSFTGKARKGLMNKLIRDGRIHSLLLEKHINGSTDDEAIAESLNRFFNYGMMTKMEMENVIFFPFASYAIRELQYQLDMLTNPNYVRFMSNIAQGMETWYKEDDDEDEATNPWYNFLLKNKGWVPMGKDWGIKLSNPMFDTFSILDDPYDAGYQRMNPMIKQINEFSKSGKFDPNQLGVGAFGRVANVFNNMRNGDLATPSKIMPSLFYEKPDYKKFTPYQYRVNYDYRNLNRQLFFQDGSRRKPSMNPYTTSKNIRYQALVNASINRHNRNR